MKIREYISKFFNLEENCIFAVKPICEFPCIICKACWRRKGCMGCNHPEKKYNENECNY